MKQFKNILVIGPFSRQLLECASSLLNTSQSKMTLMSFLPAVEKVEVATREGNSIDVESLLRSEIQRELDDTARKLDDRDFRLRTFIGAGRRPFIDVIQRVQAAKHDLVIMMADGVSTIREQLFGTLSMHLMRKCPSAVWVLKPSRRKKSRNVVAAVDPDPSDKQRDSLNAKILKRAQTIAQADSARLHIVHAWDTFGSEVDRSRRWMSKQEIRLYVEQVAIAHRNRLDQLIKQMNIDSAAIHMLNGRAGEIIPSVATEVKADLLVMGTVCRTGIPGFFIGNTAESILNQVDCSVLTVKPAGFESPVPSS